jgi:16S rRNA (uracil1498-N3)-methyltransferase
MVQLYYCPGIPHNEYILEGEEARHCALVLRQNPGDLIKVTDGEGTIYEAQLTANSSRKCTFNIQKALRYPTPVPQIHIAIAPTKNLERIEWFVEKAVEIGLTELTFLHTRHSERTKIKPDRIRKKAISAMKQSLRPFLTKINDIQKPQDFFGKQTNAKKYIAHLQKGFQLKLTEAITTTNHVIAIGPEGGFAEEEVLMAIANGFQPVKLGDHRLRTETAGILACAILSTVKGV